jgi:hypothetical protein
MLSGATSAQWSRRVATLTIVLLAAGVVVAGALGDFSM